ncbi:MAG TPA: hypothetical protein VHD62_14380 [Opitutaceae bacterium]|nr:hypothetical protein [Opitutaceae bacterium]
MKRISMFILLALGALAPAGAQTASAGYGATTAGTREFTLGASGASDRRFSGSTGGASGSYGWFLNDASELVFRQSFNFSTGSQPLLNTPPASGGAATGPTPTVTTSTRRQWDASSRIAFDQHFGSAADSRLRPFLGVNLGGVYGRSITDTWAAGLEAGGKYYVQPRTFVQGIVEYGWFFRHANALDDRFHDGQWNYSLGMGINF